jgi:hypothetical protein
LKPCAYGGGTTSRGYVAVDIENLTYSTIGQTVSIMAQLNLFSYYLPSAKGAVGVINVELKSIGVLSI